MKRILFIALCAMFCIGSAAQNDYESEFADSVASSIPQVDNTDFQNIAPQFEQSMLGMVQSFAPFGDNKPLKEVLYPLGKGLFRKHYVEQAVEVCPNITKSKVSRSELLSDQNLDEIDDTGIGLNFGYSLIFVPGREENDKLRLNKFGFAYSVGFLASFTSSDRYGTLCDFMAKVGFETCHNRKLGVGIDFLGGYGKSSGDIFFYHNIVEDTAPTLTSPYTSWGWKYGGQLWLKTGLLGNLSSHTDILLFARLITAPDPNLTQQKATSVSFNLWRQENWSFGVILRYRM